MRRVVAIVRILPENADAPPEEVIEAAKKALPADKYEILKSKAEPLAFGIHAIYIWVAMPENIEGGTTDLEKRLSDVPEISQIDVVSVSRLME